MTRIGCGIVPAATLTGLGSDLPVAAGFEAALAALMPVPGFPAGSLVDAPAGTFADIVAWQVVEGAATVGAGGVTFARSPARQRVRLALAAPVPAGTRLRLLWRQEGAGGLKVDLGGAKTGAFRHGAGWQGADLTVAETGATLDVVAQGGADGLILREIAAVPMTAAGYDILLLLGDEGITGARSGAGPDGTVDRPDPRVDVLREGWIGPALAPVAHRERGPGLGPVEAFAALYARRALAAGRRLLLVPGGRAGVALVGAEAPWRAGNGRAGAADLFGAVVADAVSALALPGDTRLVAAWWAGGAAEIAAGLAPESLGAALGGLVSDLRSALGRPDLPVVVSGANPAAASAEWLAVEAALDRDSGAPGALPGVLVVPWDLAPGHGSAPGAPAFSGGANRLRGAQAARALIDREIGAVALEVIGPNDVITAELLIAA